MTADELYARLSLIERHEALRTQPARTPAEDAELARLTRELAALAGLPAPDAADVPAWATPELA